MNSTISRTRWAAVGAAVAIMLGAGGIGVTQALGSGERTSYVPINPCRLVDTRPGADHVGDAPGALGEDATATLDAHGTHGNCNLPTEATGLALNVTAVNQTRLTYLTVWPAGADRPTTSNLNPSPGQPPTPNAVNVDLDGSGRFSIYNRFGTVDIVVDVVGYYADHHHDDRYYTKAQVDQAINAAIAAATADQATGAELAALAQAVTPIAFDSTIGVGQSEELVDLSGVKLSATCDSPTAASFQVDAGYAASGHRFWLHGSNFGPAEFTVRVGPVASWSRPGNADYLFFTGVLYSSLHINEQGPQPPRYFQLSIYSGHTGGGCVFWGVATPAYL